MENYLILLEYFNQHYNWMRCEIKIEQTWTTLNGGGCTSCQWFTTPVSRAALLPASIQGLWNKSYIKASQQLLIQQILDIWIKLQIRDCRLSKVKKKRTLRLLLKILTLEVGSYRYEGRSWVNIENTKQTKSAQRTKNIANWETCLHTRS